jgi:eukaryotic-like serine/threonine-protein kinase
MVASSLQPGSVIDGFRLEEGDMAAIWRVAGEGSALPLVMKVPNLAEGEDPAAIVGCEMEQLIMPRLSGIHVPQFIAAGDFGARPYIVMEQIPGDIKPSNVMFRPGGEAVLLDFGLSHHARLPDLMQEEFRVPFGTAPYMAPEQLLGIRNDPRSDLFATGVLLYFFSTGERPFGESESLAGMRRRLWRDPVPPRRLRPDYPPWLQEIVLRCLEIEPAWRYPTAGQLAFDLGHHDQVKLTRRSERLQRDPWTTVLRRRFNKDLKKSLHNPPTAAHLASAPIVAVAVDLAEASSETNEALRTASARILATLPSARLACLNVLKLGRITLDTTLDQEGHNKRVDRLVALRHWAEPLMLESHRLSVHVLEAVDPANAILEFASANQVDHIILAARKNSLLRNLLGSVSAKVAAEAACTVTVARSARSGKTSGVDAVDSRE